MIVFDLRCAERGDVFEAWFGSNADFDKQLKQGLIQCPICESPRVEKAPMAPRLPHRDGSAAGAKSASAAIAEVRSRLLSQSEWVGENFPQQALAMHLGEIDSRPVHGLASAEEAQSLLDEGVPILPLPLPLVPPGQVN